jgi:ribose transport system ATP-binding protein
MRHHGLFRASGDPGQWSDHVVVMRGGRVMANIDRDTPHFNSEDIMKAAWGGELD